MMSDSLLRFGDGPAGAAAGPECVGDELAEVEAARAHAEENEPASEDENQEHERPLRLVAQAGEEHRVLGYALRAATGPAAGWASMARLPLCAAAGGSFQSLPPLS